MSCFGFRPDRLLARNSGAPDGCVRRHGCQQGNLATSNPAAGVQGQRRPLELSTGSLIDRGPGPDGRFTVAGGNAHIALANPADAILAYNRPVSTDGDYPIQRLAAFYAKAQPPCNTSADRFARW